MNQAVPEEIADRGRSIDEIYDRIDQLNDGGNMDTAAIAINVSAFSGRPLSEAFVYNYLANRKNQVDREARERKAQQRTSKSVRVRATRIDAAYQKFREYSKHDMFGVTDYGKRIMLDGCRQTIEDATELRLFVADNSKQHIADMDSRRVIQYAVDLFSFGSPTRLANATKLARHQGRRMRERGTWESERITA